MCGILGGITMTPFPWLCEPGRLASAIDALAHRGPDDKGAMVSADRRAFLGHRRLAIIDVSGGRQPISSENGRIHLCHNGEIYNYRELRDRLTARGHAFKTKSDGETALHLFEENAAGFPAELAGMFAIAIYDEFANTLTLARDRCGIKPLYYYHDGPTLLFASEIKAILALLPARPAMCPAALRQYLRWKYIPTPRTIYENIFQLPPAHVLRARRDMAGGRVAVELLPYWELNYSGEKVTDERQAIEQLDERLHEAVRSHLESDVEVGALLSGGVDSSLVVALAAKISGRRIKTFTAGFTEMGFDQRPFARQVAERYNTEHFDEEVPLDAMATVPVLVKQFDQPFGDSSALACYRVCQAARRHVKVALTGDGGDETFAGYGRYEELLDGAGGPGAWTRLEARAVLATSGAIFSPEAKYLKHFREELLSPLERHAAHQELCSPWLMERLLAEPYRSAADDGDVFQELRNRAAGRGWSAMEIAQYVDLRTSLPDDMLAKVDRTSMACSLECRVPLLDHRVTEFSASLDSGLKVRGGVRKYILKKVAERYVPAELLYRPKMGFRVPIRRWFKRELLDQTADLLQGGVLVGRGIIDAGGLRWMLGAQRRPWIDFGSQLWALLFLEHWARLYLA